MKRNVQVLLKSATVLLFSAFIVARASAQTWVKLSPIGEPPAPRNDALVAVYDPSSNRLITFGGITYCCTNFNDVWVLTNANGLAGIPEWIKLTPSGPQGFPAPRGRHSAVYDVNNNRMIIFGGGNFTGDPACSFCIFNPLFNDAWVLTNANGLGDTPTWLPLFPVGGPPAPRAGHHAVYDPVTNRMTIFGGGNNGIMVVPNDVWVLTNANGLGGTPEWVQLTPTGQIPAPVEAFAIGYDTAHNIMTIFGGCCPFTNATFTLSHANGLGGFSQWTNLSVSSPVPSIRGTWLYGYNPVQNKLVIFGEGAFGVVHDTWVLNNPNGLGTPEWLNLIPDGAPGSPPVPDTVIGGTYDVGHNRLILLRRGVEVPASVGIEVWVLDAAPPAQSCIPDKVVSVDIADSCGVLQWLQPPWSQRFGDGTTLEVSCSWALNIGRLPAPAYMAWFTDSTGNRSRIAQCLFRDGVNDATYTVGHVSGNPAQSCLASVDWHNVDGGANDGPRQATDFLGNPIIFTTNIEPYIDAVDYQFDANGKKLSWKDEKFKYPDAKQFADQFAVGDILNRFVQPVAGLTFSVDPLIGPELDNAFDTAWLEMQSDPGGPMKFIPGCDLNGDGVCDSSDQAMLATAFGKCAGQPGYIPRIDYDGDGCISVSDAAVVQASFSAYRAGCVQSQGYWKNHPANWPITSLSIGGNQYNQNELLAILQSSVSGNGAINLAHQLIAAKLNIASGASPVAAPVASADALLNSVPGRLPPLGNASLPQSSVSGVGDTLARFNEGLIGPPECEE